MKFERVDRIPIVLGILQQMGVQLIIDACYEPHGNHQGLSVGWLAEIFLVYILAETDHKMAPVQKWVDQHHHTLERLTGQRIRASDFTDDRLGDVLRYLSQDELWWHIDQGLSQRSIRVYQLAGTEPVRLDATVGGVKHNEKKHTLFKSGRNKQGVVEVQFKLMLGVLDPLGMPLAADVVSGNVSDDPLYVPIYQRIRRTLGKAGLLYIGDSKMSPLDTRSIMAMEGDYYLTPLAMVGHIPLLLDELLSLVEAGQLALTKVHFPEELPSDPETEPDPVLAIAEGVEVVREQQVTLENGKVVTWSERLLVIRSHAFAEAKQIVFEQRLDKAEAALLALTPSSGRGRRQFDDPLALQQAIDQLLARYRVVDYFDLRLERHSTIRQIRAYKGKPARTEEKVRYQIHVTRRQEAIAQAQFRLGWRVYATNAPVKMLNLTEAVLAYRDQYLAERPFARLKGPLLAMLPLYVQRDDHAKGLIRLLTIGLRALSITEFVVRRSLAEANETLSGLYDGNPKRCTARPSAELLLQAFDDITLSIRLNQEGEVVEQYLTPLNEVQARILELLGLSPDIYHCLAGIPLILPLSQGEVRPENILVC
jgi:transposase